MLNRSLLAAEQMPPTNGAGFCKYVSARSANVLFDSNAAASMMADESLRASTSPPPDSNASGQTPYTGVMPCNVHLPLGRGSWSSGLPLNTAFYIKDSLNYRRLFGSHTQNSIAV
jgi:hypothetical protein